MTPGLRFTHPTIAHFRFAEECGFTLAKYGPGDYEVQAVPKGWRLVRNTSTQLLKRQGDFVIDIDASPVSTAVGLVLSANPDVADVEFADGRAALLNHIRLVHVEGDGADSEKLWDKAAASHRVRAAFRSAGVLS